MAEEQLDRLQSYVESVRRGFLCGRGTVWINCCNIFDGALPFGGYKQTSWAAKWAAPIAASAAGWVSRLTAGS